MAVEGQSLCGYHFEHLVEQRAERAGGAYSDRIAQTDLVTTESIQLLNDLR